MSDKIRLYDVENDVFVDLTQEKFDEIHRIAIVSSMAIAKIYELAEAAKKKPFTHDDLEAMHASIAPYENTDPAAPARLTQDNPMVQP